MKLTARYNQMLRQMAQHQRKREYGKWARLSERALALRERMIAHNRGHSTPTKPVPITRMSPETKRWYKRAYRTKSGRAVAHRFVRFWKISGPPKIDLKPGPGGRKKVHWLVGMGTTPAVFLSTTQKGQRGGKKTTVHGKWKVNTEGSGKHVILLSSRPISGSFKFVGFAPQTHYVPPPDIEAAGSHKAGSYWIHKHGVNDKDRADIKRLVWPAVFADRNGRVDKDSNFIYGKNKLMQIEDWMYG